MPTEIPARTTVTVNIIEQTNIFLMRNFTNAIFTQYWLNFCNNRSNGEILGNKMYNILT